MCDNGCTYHYKMHADLSELTEFERGRLRVMYRWLRTDGLMRAVAKGYVDRTAMLMLLRGTL